MGSGQTEPQLHATARQGPLGRRLGPDDPHLVGNRQQQAGDAIGVDQLVEMRSWKLLDDPAPPMRL